MSFWKYKIWGFLTNWENVIKHHWVQVESWYYAHVMDMGACDWCFNGGGVWSTVWCWRYYIDNLDKSVNTGICDTSNHSDCPNHCHWQCLQHHNDHIHRNFIIVLLMLLLNSMIMSCKIVSTSWRAVEQCWCKLTLYNLYYLHHNHHHPQHLCRHHGLRHHHHWHSVHQDQDGSQQPLVITFIAAVAPWWSKVATAVVLPALAARWRGVLPEIKKLQIIMIGKIVIRMITIIQVQRCVAY